LVAGHQQHRRALFGVLALLQQTVGAEQAVSGGVVRLAARTVQQMVQAITQHEVWARFAGVEHVGCPVCDALAIDAQVVAQRLVAGERLGNVDIQQMNKRVLAYRDHLASDLGRVFYAIKGKFRLQGLRCDQPNGQALWLQAAQYRAGENKG
jgi:hypothetical protein